jgi:glyoxylase I family protein
MLTDHVFAGLAIVDIDAARAWYERLFGRAPDLIPHESEVAWQLTDSGWVYVVADAERAGSGLLTLLVDDLDRVRAELAERGIDAGEVETITGAVRVVIFDADGNRIAIGQPLSA